MRNVLLSMIVLSTLARPSPAPADPADTRLSTGIRQVEEGDLAGAVDTLADLVRELSAHPARSKELAQAHLYLGMAYVLLDYEKAGRASFREALGIDGDLRLPKAPAKVQRVFDEVLEAMPAPSAAAGPAAAPPTVAGPPRSGPRQETRPGDVLIVTHGWDYEKDDPSWDVRASSLAGDSRVLAGGAGNQIYPFAFPDGKSVGFMVEESGSESRGFRKVDLATAAIESLGVSNSASSACQVSPDGSRLACADDTGKNKQVVVHDLATKARQAITQGRNQCLDPTWSPDGRSLAYWTGKDEAQVGDEAKPKGYHLAVYDFATDQHRLLTRADKAYDAYPRWSPSGEWIAFHRKGDSRGEWNIWIVHPDGTGETQLTTSQGESSHPTWSPDATRIAFQRYQRDSDTYDIGFVEVATKKVTPITRTDQVSEEYPVWVR
jgi:hypothetical protein